MTVTLDRLLKQRYLDTPDAMERLAIILLLSRRHGPPDPAGRVLARVETSNWLARRGDPLVFEYREPRPL